MSNEKFIVYLDDSTDLFTEHCIELKTLSTTTTTTNRHQSIKHKYYANNDSPATQVAKFIRGLKSERIATTSSMRPIDNDVIEAPVALTDDSTAPCDDVITTSSNRKNQTDKKATCVSNSRSHSSRFESLTVMC